MVLRYITGATAAIALSGALAVEPAYAQLRDGGLLPQGESALMTIAGCLIRGGDAVGIGNREKELVLANPKRGPINSVTEAECTAAAGDNALQLHRYRGVGINDQLVGRWVEISGRLEKENSNNPNNLREFYVRSFRVLPVVPPERVAVAVITPESQPAAAAPEPAPSPEPAPAATSGQEPTAPAPLPKTAGNGPTTALIGV